MHVAAAGQKDTDLTRLYRLAGGRANGRSDRDVEQLGDDDRMFCIALDRHDQDLRADLGRTGDPQPAGGNRGIRYPSALNTFRLY